MKREDVVFISPEALVFLARITRSCRAACSYEMESFKAYVSYLAQKGEKISLESFTAGSPLEAPFFHDIVSYLQERRLVKIEGDEILKFFGSRWHISKILADMREKTAENLLPKEESFQQGFLFDHVLTLHYIYSWENANPRSCFYQDGKCFFESLKLILPDSSSGLFLKKGDRLLLHFGEVISVNPSEEVISFISQEQQNQKEFRQAVAFLSKLFGKKRSC